MHLTDLVPVSMLTPAAAGGSLLLLCLLAVGAWWLLHRCRRPEAPTRRCHACRRELAAGARSCPLCGAPVASEPAELEFVSGPLRGRRLALEGEVTTIGAAATNTVALTDTGVAPRHVGIRREADGYELADLGSLGGVHVNGERVARRRLTNGDVIRLGTSEMIFRVRG